MTILQQELHTRQRSLGTWGGVTRTEFQGIWRSYKVDGNIAAGIRYTAVHITMYLHNASLYTGMYEMLSYKSDLAAKGYHNLLWTYDTIILNSQFWFCIYSQREFLCKVSYNSLRDFNKTQIPY